MAIPVVMVAVASLVGAAEFEGAVAAILARAAAAILVVEAR